MSTDKSCLTCGWGVKWFEDVLDPEHISGLCQWKCPVPHPHQFGARFYYSTESTPEVDCPAWKQAENLDHMQRWAERPLDYHTRLLAQAEAAVAELERMEKFRRQCLNCANEPKWKPFLADMQEGVCKAGKYLHRFRDDVLVGLGETAAFLQDVCPAFISKKADRK